MGKWTKIWRFVPAMPDKLQSFAELNQGSGAPCSRRPRSVCRRLVRLICFTLFGVLVSSATDVVTYHNNIARTGENPHEVILTTSNVNASSFGKLFTFPVD